jgi:hypothetical protein
VTACAWLLAGYDAYSRIARPDRPPRELVCWMDRRYGEMCEPVERWLPDGPRRHYVVSYYYLCTEVLTS